MSNSEKASFYERLRKGLGESIAHSRGELSLKTTELPAPPPKARARQIADLRRRLRMSQAVFAATLNVSPKTIQSWEQGIRQPADAALRMLQVVSERPDVIRMLFSSRRAPTRRAGPNGNRRNRTLEKVGV